MRAPASRTAASAAACVCLVLFGCKSPTSPKIDVAGIVSAVETDGPIAGVKKPGVPPPPSGGPGATVTMPDTAQNGGASATQVRGASPFRKILLSVDALTGSDGFFEITLPAAVIEQSVILSFASAIEASAFETRIQLVSDAGSVGPIALKSVTVVPTSAAVASIVSNWNPTVALFGRNPCPDFPVLRCLYISTLTMREVNGVGVTFATSRRTDVTATGAPITINDAKPFVRTVPSHGTFSEFFERVCHSIDTPGCPEAFHPFPGFVTFQFEGTDTNGRPFTHTTPILTYGGEPSASILTIGPRR